MQGGITQDTGAGIPYNNDSTKQPLRLILGINVCQLFHADLPPLPSTENCLPWVL